MAELLTQQLLAEYLDLDVRSIRNLEKEGLQPRKVKGEKRYPWPASLHWYLKYKAAAAKKSTASQRIQDARAEREELGIERERLDLLERQGQLVSLDFMDRELEAVLRNLRAGLLVFPGRWASELVGCATTEEVRAKLDAAIEELMTALARVGDDDGEPADDETGDAGDDGDGDDDSDDAP